MEFSAVVTLARRTVKCGDDHAADVARQRYSVRLKDLLSLEVPANLFGNWPPPTFDTQLCSMGLSIELMLSVVIISTRYPFVLHSAA